MSVDTAFLIGRIRSEIGEPYGNDDPLRSDPELAAWAQEGLMDYISKIPLDSVPELITESVFTGSSWTIPSDFMRLLQIEVSHTVSGTETEIVTAFVLPIDGGYVADQYDGGLGAFAQFHAGTIKVGPNAIGGTVSYAKRPITLATGCPTFPLGDQHADAIINYAASKALEKVNDENSATYMKIYLGKVQAEQQRFGMVLDVEKQD